jgi:hypothetical protein
MSAIVKIKLDGNITIHNKTIYRDVEENLLWDPHQRDEKATIMMFLVICTVFLAVLLKNKLCDRLTKFVPESGEPCSQI